MKYIEHESMGYRKDGHKKNFMKREAFDVFKYRTFERNLYF